MALPLCGSQYTSQFLPGIYIQKRARSIGVLAHLVVNHLLMLIILLQEREELDDVGILSHSEVYMRWCSGHC